MFAAYHDLGHACPRPHSSEGIRSRSLPLVALQHYYHPLLWQDAGHVHYELT